MSPIRALRTAHYRRLPHIRPYAYTGEATQSGSESLSGAAAKGFPILGSNLLSAGGAPRRERRATYPGGSNSQPARHCPPSPRRRPCKRPRIRGEQ